MSAEQRSWRKVWQWEGVEVFGCSDSDRCLFSLSHAAVTEQRFWFALCVQVFEFQGGEPTAEAAAGWDSMGLEFLLVLWLGTDKFPLNP